MLWKSLVWISCAAAWTISKSAVAVSGGGDVTDRVPVEKLTGPVELYDGRSLDIAFKVAETPAPHQIMVRVHLAEEEGAGSRAELIDKSILAKMRGNNAKVVLPFKGIPVELHNYPLKVSAIVSGPSDAPVEQVLFDLIVYGDKDETKPPVRLTGSGHQLASKPIIEHQFRAPAKHVSPYVAFVFIGAIDVLFGGLLYVWATALGIKLHLTASRQLLLALVLLIESSFVGYYVNWSIFTLISALAVLVPVLFVTYNHFL